MQGRIHRKWVRPRLILVLDVLKASIRRRLVYQVKKNATSVLLEKRTPIMDQTVVLLVSIAVIIRKQLWKDRLNAFHVRPVVWPKKAVPSVSRAVRGRLGLSLGLRASHAILVSTVRAVWVRTVALNAPLVSVKATQDRRRVLNAALVNSTM